MYHRIASGPLSANKMLFYLLIAALPFIFAQSKEDQKCKPFNCINVSEQPSGKHRIISTSIETLDRHAHTDLCPIFNRCMENCGTTKEYNPVCGTDNVTYSNPGKLCCAQLCGKDIDIKHPGECSTDETC